MKLSGYLKVGKTYVGTPQQRINTGSVAGQFPHHPPAEMVAGGGWIAGGGCYINKTALVINISATKTNSTLSIGLYLAYVIHNLGHITAI
jgi:hypothetical protein